jgi:hypothetical protein
LVRWRRPTGSAEGGAEQRSAPAAASSHAASGSEGGDGSARGAAHAASSTRRPHRRTSHANNSNCIQGEVVLGQPTVMYRTQPSQLSGPAAAAASAAAAAVAAASGPSQRFVVQAAARAAAAAAANSVAEQMEQHNAAPWPTTTTSSTSSAPPRPDRADPPRRASQTSLGSSAGEEWPTRGASREEAEVYQPYSSLYSVRPPSLPPIFPLQPTAGDCPGALVDSASIHLTNRTQRVALIPLNPQLCFTQSTSLLPFIPNHNIWLS